MKSTYSYSLLSRMWLIYFLILKSWAGPISLDYSTYVNNQQYYIKGRRKLRLWPTGCFWKQAYGSCFGNLFGSIPPAYFYAESRTKTREVGSRWNILHSYCDCGQVDSDSTEPISASKMTYNYPHKSFGWVSFRFL